LKPKAQREAERLARHQAEFVCGVCGAPSAGPLRTEQRTPQYNHAGQVIGSIITGLEQLDWDTPRSLERCMRCGGWACIPAMTRRDCLRGRVCGRCRGEKD
jgi:hypothetical protein